MAHDFSIAVQNETSEYVCFFGFLGGIAYSAFNAQEFNNGLSGSNDGKVISKSEAEAGVKAMIEKFKTGQHYETEIAEFTTFLNEKILTQDDSVKFFVHYS